MMPFGYLLTLINIDKLMHGAKEVHSDEEEFMRMMRMF